MDITSIFWQRESFRIYFIPSSEFKADHSDVVYSEKISFSSSTKANSKPQLFPNNGKMWQLTLTCYVKSFQQTILRVS